MTGREDELDRLRTRKSSAPVASCLICGSERPLGVWREGTTVGVCEPCRDAARTFALVDKALAQACINLATFRPDETRPDGWSIGDHAQLWRECLLAGWGGPLGFPFDPERDEREES